MDELNMKKPMMGMTQPELPPHHVSKTMKVLLSVFAAVLLGVLGYFVWYENTQTTTEEDTTASVKKSTGSTATTGSGTTTTADKTADWKTYTNSTYKFSMKYPSAWTLRNDGEGVAEIYSNYGAGRGLLATETKVVINVYDNSTNQSIESYLGEGATILSKSSVMVGGVSATNYSIKPEMGYQISNVLFAQNSNVYSILTYESQTNLSALLASFTFN